MENSHTDHNNDKEKPTSERQSAFDNHPDVPLEDGTLQVNLCRVGHSCPSCPYRLIEQESDDVDSKLPLSPTHDSNRQEASHMLRNVRVESPIHSQSQAYENLPVSQPLSPVPCKAFTWYEPDPYFYVLYFQGKYSEICIIDTGEGTYGITVGDNTIDHVPTLRQAQSICHHIAWTFRNSLPAPRYRISHDSTLQNAKSQIVK